MIVRTESIPVASNSHSNNESNDTVIPLSTHKSQHNLEENQFEQIFVVDQDSVGRQTLIFIKKVKTKVQNNFKTTPGNHK